ncbi:MAG TPA: type II toxin-antitoxin system VapC family toxin [Thermoanaerobaculia bacterium]|jgi:predicted nucleic acid-binding protein
MPVVDASVYVALFKSDEPGHEASRAWLAEAGEAEEPIASPVILLAEVASALGRGLEDEELARQAVSLLRVRRLVELFPVTETLAARAAEIASEQRLRGCDSIYVALAKQLEMELVTLDGQQLERGALVVATRTP